jgi:hypothetical protein
MARDSGRSNTPGNMKGASKPIKIAMKDPQIHRKIQKSK